MCYLKSHHSRLGFLLHSPGMLSERVWGSGMWKWWLSPSFPGTMLPLAVVCWYYTGSAQEMLYWEGLDVVYSAEKL